jgi:L-threonylcarbamoyladenylate synthase
MLASRSRPSPVLASDVSGQQIASWLSAGSTVVLPTDTVYGLAVKPDLPTAVQRVFELKGRPQEVNLPVMIGATEQLDDLGVDYNPAARRLAESFWPGPLTLVMGFASDRRRPAWLDGRLEVAIRLPDYKLLRETAAAAGPILVTSANGHGTGPKRVASEATLSLLGTADVVIDGGTLSPLPSTIVNTRLSLPQIERVGAIAAAEIIDLLGETKGTAA